MISEDYELWEGVLVRKMAHNHLHRLVTSALIRWLVSVFGIEYHLSGMSVEFPRPNGGVSQLDPDITILAYPEPTYDEGNPSTENTVLVVEVSDSTFVKDTTTKAAIYARAGVQDYWVADVQGRQMIIHRKPSANGFGVIAYLGADEEVAPLARPDAKIRVGDIFAVVKHEAK